MDVTRRLSTVNYGELIEIARVALHGFVETVALSSSCPLCSIIWKCVLWAVYTRTYASGRLSLPTPALVGEAAPLGAALQPVPLDAGIRHPDGLGARHKTRHGLLGVAAHGRIWNKREE